MTFKLTTTMRSLLLILFTLSIAACMRPVAPTPTTVTEAPKGTILTVILEIRPPSDSLHVFDVIRGAGRLRNDYPAAFTEELPTGHLLFTFRSADERILKQTSQPFPGPNEYEVPSEEGTIERVTLPEDPRSINLRTQDFGGLKWLDISGTTNKGRIVTRRIDLRAN
jgi:hypothetical protein